MWQMKELEEKYKEREQQWQQTHRNVEAVKAAATPEIVRSRVDDECQNEIDARILRSSNSVNRQTNQSSALLKGNDSTQQMRNKRQFRSNEVENHYAMPMTSLHERKITRKSDPPRIVRTGRLTTKPPIVASQAPLSHKRASTSRDQAQGVKERDSKKKIWS